MRLLSVGFAPFGALRGVELDFGDRPSVLHVIAGPNEAGKSTALRGIVGFFFGIDHLSRDQHERGVELRVRARLATRDGRVLDLVRRKGLKDTLRDGATDAPVGEAALSSLLAGIDRDTFTQLYGLGAADLRRGGESILRGEGRLGEVLLEASTGATGLVDQLAALRAEANALYDPKRRATDLHKAVHAYREAVRDTGQASLSHKSWLDQQAGIAETRAQVAEADAQLRELRDEATKLEHVASLAQPLRRLRRKRSRRAELGVVADVPEGSAALRDELAREAREALAEAERAEGEAARLAAELELTRARARSMPGDLDRSRARAVRADIERSQRTRTELRAERDADARRLDEAAAVLGPAPPGLGWDGLDVGARVIAGIHAAAAKRDAAADALETARRVLADLLAAAPIAVDLDARETDADDLAAAIGEGRRALSAARALDELAERRLTTSARLAETLALASARDFRALDALSLPGLAALDEEARRRAARAEDRATLERDRAGAAARSVELEAKLRALTDDRDLPSDARLHDARAGRDDALRVAHRLLGSGDVTGAMAALVRLGADIAAADVLADRLRANEARVQQAAALAVEVRSAQTAAAVLAEKARAARALDEDAERAFADRFADVRGSSLDVVRDLVARRIEARAQHGELEAIEARRTQLEAEVVAAMRRLGATDPAPRASELEGLVASAEARAARVRRENGEREAAATRARSHAERAAAAERELHRAAAEFAERRAAFGRRVAPYGLDETATLEETRAHLDALAHVVLARRRQADLASRLAAVEIELAEAEASWSAIVEAAGLGGCSIEEAAARADVALDARAELPRLEAAHASHREVARSARTRAERASAKLAEIAERTGVVGDALAAAEEKAREARMLDRDIAHEEHVLVERSGHASLPLAEEHLRDVDFEATEERLERVRADIEALEARRDRDLRTVGNRERGLAELGGESRAAELAMTAESHLLRARDLARRAAIARTAVALLEREVDRYRAERAGPALGRAGALFAALTAGRWSGLRAEDREDGTPEIRGVRAERSYAVDELSEGTRDQLYLALRLAALEHHARAGAPLPLVLDDVLVHFDDERAEAAILALADVAKTVQVLLFTHEQRIAELARRALAPNDVLVHELARTP